MQVRFKKRSTSEIKPNVYVGGGGGTDLATASEFFLASCCYSALGRPATLNLLVALGVPLFHHVGCVSGSSCKGRIGNDLILLCMAAGSHVTSPPITQSSRRFLI